MCRNPYCRTFTPPGERCNACQQAYDDGYCGNSTCGIGWCEKRTPGKKDGFCTTCRTIFHENKEAQGLRQCRAIEVEGPNQGQPCPGYAVEDHGDGYCYHHHDIVPSFERYHDYMSK